MNKYSNEFKEESDKRVLSALPASQVAREIGVNVNSFYTYGSTRITRKLYDNGHSVNHKRGQYCSNAYKEMADQYHFVRRMSRKGNCWDNAPMESFWGSLK